MPFGGYQGGNSADLRNHRFADKCVVPPCIEKHGGKILCIIDNNAQVCRVSFCAAVWGIAFMVIFLILSCVAESGDLCEGNKKAAPFSAACFAYGMDFKQAQKSTARLCGAVAISGCKFFALHDEMPSEDKNIGEILNQNSYARLKHFIEIFLIFHLSD